MAGLLIVEDEHLIATMLADWLAEMGFEVVGIARSNREALAMLEHTVPTGAILDLLVEDGMTYPVARELQQRTVPFVFATGYSGENIDASFPDAGVAMKPFEFDRLHELLTRILPQSEVA